MVAVDFRMLRRDEAAKTYQKEGENDAPHENPLGHVELDVDSAVVSAFPLNSVGPLLSGSVVCV